MTSTEQTIRPQTIRRAVEQLTPVQRERLTADGAATSRTIAAAAGTTRAALVTRAILADDGHTYTDLGLAVAAHLARNAADARRAALAPLPDPAAITDADRAAAGRHAHVSTARIGADHIVLISGTRIGRIRRDGSRWLLCGNDGAPLLSGDGVERTAGTRAGAARALAADDDAVRVYRDVAAGGNLGREAQAAEHSRQAAGYAHLAAGVAAYREAAETGRPHTNPVV